MVLAHFPVRQEVNQKYLNITEKVQSAVDEFRITAGHIHVMVMHTTCALALQEDEPCLINDLFAALYAFAHPAAHYAHDSSARTKNLDPDRKERRNGYAHLWALWMNRQELTIPVRDGKLFLGRWQQILFFDFDTQERIQRRTITVSVIGSPAAVDGADVWPQPKDWETG